MCGDPRARIEVDLVTLPERDLINLCTALAECAEHRPRMLAEARRRQTEAVPGRRGERHRYCGRQHLSLGRMLDAFEKTGLGEIGIGQQAREVGDDTVWDIEPIK